MILTRRPQGESSFYGFLGVPVRVHLTGGLGRRYEQRTRRRRLMRLHPMPGDNGGRHIPALEGAGERSMVPSAAGPWRGGIEGFSHQIMSKGSLARPAVGVVELDEDPSLEQLVDHLVLPGKLDQHVESDR